MRDHSDGCFESVNDALCQLFGYDAETFMQKNWRELTVPDYLETDLKNVDDLMKGRADSFRLIKQYIHADGHLIWGTPSTSVRDGNGRWSDSSPRSSTSPLPWQPMSGITFSLSALSARGNAWRRNCVSAADYMSSIMPRGLTGVVDIAFVTCRRGNSVATVSTST